MITHLVLFRPRTDLSPSARLALMTAFEAALREIPSLRGARVGKRLLTGRSYESLARVDYQYAAVLEFDDVAGLEAYLDHPSHAQLASQFFQACEETVMYDFEPTEGTAGLASAHTGTH